jgi:hypothetical protein
LGWDECIGEKSFAFLVGWNDDSLSDDAVLSGEFLFAPTMPTVSNNSMMPWMWVSIATYLHNVAFGKWLAIFNQYCLAIFLASFNTIRA